MVLPGNGQGKQVLFCCAGGGRCCGSTKNRSVGKNVPSADIVWAWSSGTWEGPQHTWVRGGFYMKVSLETWFPCLPHSLLKQEQLQLAELDFVISTFERLRLHHIRPATHPKLSFHRLRARQSPSRPHSWGVVAKHCPPTLPSNQTNHSSMFTQWNCGNQRFYEWQYRRAKESLISRLHCDTQFFLVPVWLGYGSNLLTPKLGCFQTTLWEPNAAIENSAFAVDLPMNNPICKGFTIAVFDYRMVNNTIFEGRLVPYPLVWGGVLINNLVVLRLFVFFSSPSCFVMGWGGVITSCYDDIIQLLPTCLRAATSWVGWGGVG